MPALYLGGRNYLSSKAISYTSIISLEQRVILTSLSWYAEMWETQGELSANN